MIRLLGRSGEIKQFRPSAKVTIGGDKWRTRFSLSQLEAFYWVARLGSFHAAADHMLLSQPSVTLRVHKLEEAIETILFDRSGYRPHLTTEGGLVLKYAQQALELAGKIQAFRNKATRPGRLLRFGLTDSTALIEMDRLLDIFEEKFPDLWIDLTIDYSSKLNSLLAEGKLDIAVLAEPNYYPEIRIIPVGKIELCWATSSKIDWPSDVIRPEDLLHHRIVTNPHPSNLHSSILNWFAAAGLRPEHISTCNTLQGISQLIGSGFAVGLMPLDLLKRQPGHPELRAHPASPAIDPHSLCVCYNAPSCDKILQAVSSEIVAALSNADNQSAVAGAEAPFKPVV